MAELLKTPITILHVLTCLLLAAVVLLQPGKSGGLGAFGGAGAQQVFGGRGASNLLTKTTWVAATMFFLTSVSLAYLSSSHDASLAKRAAEKTGSSAPAPAPTPASSK